MRFELEETNRGVSDEDLIEDLRRCGAQTGGDTITASQYRSVGRFHERTFAKRFRSWSNALHLAGLRPSRASEFTDEELFENIRKLWTDLGRQPRYREMRHPGSRYSVKAYKNRFGSWSEALKLFVAWVNSDATDRSASGGVALAAAEEADPPGHSVPRRSRRDVSERQRFRILLRDGFRCISCGASPLREPGVELHVDHIVPWSAGGETNDDNLGAKCSRCNLGKGNAFHA